MARERGAQGRQILAVAAQFGEFRRQALMQLGQCVGLDAVLARQSVVAVEAIIHGLQARGIDFHAGGEGFDLR